MKRLTAFITLAVASVGLLAFLAGGAAADSIGPIDFEAPAYHTGDINGQQGWLKLNPLYDVAVAPVSGVNGFGAQALRLSDAYTTGAFGDQTFSPGLASAAGESGQHFFDASFELASPSLAVQPGLHLSVSPDDGSGGRMSYLRFEDQADGIHVYFDDATDPGPVGTVATFDESQIGMVSRGIAHTFRFRLEFNPGPANDLAQIWIDGNLAHTGTTWEDYYRYDPEQAGNGNVIPQVRKLLFREAGGSNPGNAGGGFLVDGVSLSSSSCTPTGLVRDNIDLTAAQIGGDVTGTVDATGCNIGVYYGPGTSGSVANANVFGANYYGVVANAAAVDVTDSQIHDIGETPLNGTQHGVGVLYTTVDQAGNTTGSAASGTLSGTTITNYQKNGVVVSGVGAFANVLDDNVTGQGPIAYIAQNGIQVSFGASGVVRGNTVSGNWYTPEPVTACGLLFFQANGVKQGGNALSGNETNVCNVGRGGGNVKT